MCLWFSMIFSFLTILQVLHCAFLIFHVFDCFWPYSRSNIVCVSFSTVFQFSCHIPGLIVHISHFSCFSVFFAIFKSIKCLCLIFHFFQFSRHISVQQCVFLIFHVFNLSRHITCPTVCISHLSRFTVFFTYFRS